MKRIASTLSLILLGWATIAPTSRAQVQIVPAADGTATLVTPNGDRIDIHGGSRSSDGANLFHSFEAFGLSAQQIANFLSDSQVRNILGRVVGGEASVIDGTLQISGSNANLFLVNPSGIIFGSNARLNLPADFFATTANAIGFSDTLWFNALGSNNYQTLVGTPTQFAFDTARPGAIANAGSLEVIPGGSLTLLGGAIANTGTLRVPGGEITIAAVEGSNRVRISQTGHLLSLEILPQRDNSGQLLPVTVANLPELLTGSVETGLQANPDGSVGLQATGQNIAVAPGTAIASGTLDTSGHSPRASINIIGDRVGVLGGHLDASSSQDGGTIRIGGGFQGQDPIPNASQTWVDRNTSISVEGQTGGTAIVWSDGATHFSGAIAASGSETGGFVEVSGRTGLSFTGTVDAGVGGTLLLDPEVIVISEDGDPTPVQAILFDDFPGELLDIASSAVLATLNLGTNVVLQADRAISVTAPIEAEGPQPGEGGNLTLEAGETIEIDAPISTDGGTLTLRSIGSAAIQSQIDIRSNIDTNGGNLNANTTGNIVVGSEDIDTLTLATSGSDRVGDLTLQAEGTLTIESNLNTAGGNSIVPSPSGIVEAGGVAIATEGGRVLVNATGRIELGDIDTGGGEVRISGPADIVTGQIDSGLALVLSSSSGAIATGDLSLGGDGSSPSELRIAAAEGINAGDVSVSNAPLTLDSTNGAIATGDLTLESSEPSALRVTAAEGINTGDISVSNALLNLDSTGGAIATGIVATSLPADIDLQAATHLEIGAIDTNNIDADGGNVTIQAASGSVTGGAIDLGTNATGATVSIAAGDRVELGEIKVSGAEGDGGTLDAIAANTLSLESIDASGLDGGTVRLEGDITIGDIDISGDTGSGGNLTLSGNLATLGNLRAASNDGTGGAIAITASTLDIASIDASGDRGGSVNLGTGAIAVGDIDVSGTSETAGAIAISGNTLDLGALNANSSGGGGSVEITAGDNVSIERVEAIGSSSGNVNIETEGRLQIAGTPTSIATGSDGTVTIRHGGVNSGLSFIVGDDSSTLSNGTRGSIAIGEDGIFVPPARELFGDVVQGPLQILGGPPAPVAPDPDPQPETPLDTALDELENDNLPITLEEVSTSLQPPTATEPPREEVASEETQDEVPEVEAVVVRANRFETPAFAGRVEVQLTREYETFFANSETEGNPLCRGRGVGCRTVSIAEGQNILLEIERATEVKPALIYAVFAPPTLAGDNILQQEDRDRSGDRLELILVTSNRNPIRRQLNVTRAEVLEAAAALQTATANPFSSPARYLPPAQQLHQWLIAPLEAELQAQEIANLSFILDAGLRSVPLAALHDGDRFAIEDYSLGLMPSLSLTNTSYASVREASVLAMGAESFTEQVPLPAVPVELETIADRLWQGESLLDEEFTVENFTRLQTTRGYGIIHLATHGEFTGDRPEDAYIQFWDEKLRLDQLRQLPLNEPTTVELMVLSACRTALGDEEAELGFAGLAAQAGVKTAIGSLWYVSDQGTLSLMSEFYQQLQTAPIKAEALRQAQLAMLRGEIRLEGGRIITSRSGLEIPLPDEIGDGQGLEFDHPFYWAAFTAIGSPW